MLIFLIIATVVGSVVASVEDVPVTTADRIRSHGYPVETYEVLTEDGCYVTLFRIPHSPKNQNDTQRRQVVFLMHGLMMSSDVWVLLGPTSSLAFNLADAGFDVWMGNARGNRYGLKKASLTFWHFSWYEIAIYDLKAMFLFVLSLTGQTGIHYISHMEGSTCILVLLSERPEFNQKMLSIQMMGPLAYMDNAKSPILKMMAPFLGTPSVLTEMAGSSEFLLNEEVVRTLTATLCTEGSPLLELCKNVLLLIVGYNPDSLNIAIVPEIWATTPAGGSSLEFFHYLQIFESKRFRKYDYGLFGNLFIYGQPTPPKFQLNKVVAPLRLIYCSNDLMNAPEDVFRLAAELPNVSNITRMGDELFNHIDYVFSTNVKVVNDDLIGYIRKNL